MRSLVMPSAGLHIVLPGYYSPKTMGLLDPATSDGRIIFFLPWEGVCVGSSWLPFMLVYIIEKEKHVENEQRSRDVNCCPKKS